MCPLPMVTQEAWGALRTSRIFPAHGSEPPQQGCPEGQLGSRGPASLGLGDMAEQGTRKIPSGAALGQACSPGTSSLLGQLPGEMPAHRPPGRPGPLCAPAVNAARYIPPHPQISALGAPLSLGQADLLEEWDGLQCPRNGPRTKSEGANSPPKGALTMAPTGWTSTLVILVATLTVGDKHRGPGLSLGPQPSYLSTSVKGKRGHTTCSDLTTALVNTPCGSESQWVRYGH